MKNQKYNSKLRTRKALVFLSIILTITSCFMLLKPESVAAQGTNLRISPSSLELKAIPPTSINAPIVIENLGNDTADILIQLRQIKAGNAQNGQVEFVPGNVPDFFKNITILEDNEPKTRITIGSKQKKSLTLRINLSENHAPSDYYFSVVFIQSDEPSEISEAINAPHSFTQINLGIATNVLLSIKDKNQNTDAEKDLLIVEEFSAPSFVSRGPVDFTIKIQNKASQYIKPKGSIYITNMFGQLIGKVDLPSQNILAHSSRYLGSQSQDPRSNLPAGKAGIQDPKITWQETFLLGPYDAVLEIETGPNSEPITQSIRFIAVPIKLTLTITFALIFGLIIYKRAKKKMSER